MHYTLSVAEKIAKTCELFDPELAIIPKIWFSEKAKINENEKVSIGTATLEWQSLKFQPLNLLISSS